MASTSSVQSMPATLTWEVDNFVSLNCMINSKKFALPTNEKLEFTLCLYPKCENKFLGESTTIFLNFGSKFNETCHMKLWIIDANGDKCMKQEAIIKYVFNSGYVTSGQCNFWNNFLLNTANGLLVNGKLTIYCEVNVVEFNEDNESTISKINSSQEKPSKISEDFKSLLESENFSDVLLVVGEKEFRVHKAILAARSTVFKAMFEHECVEKKQNRVEIIDLEVEVCEEFLRYIYTGNVTQLDRFATELMAAADKYQLVELKSICEQFLCDSLDIGSVASVLQLADMHNAEQLKSKCIEYITANAKDVQDTEGWKKLFIAKPELGFQLFLKVANRK